MNLERHVADYLEAQRRSGTPSASLQEEGRLLARYVTFCDERLLRPFERCRFKALFMYRDWLKEQPFPPDLQKQHLSALYRLAAFVSETPESGFQKRTCRAVALGRKRNNRDKSGTGAKNA